MDQKQSGHSTRTCDVFGCAYSRQGRKSVLPYFVAFALAAASVSLFVSVSFDLAPVESSVDFPSGGGKALRFMTKLSSGAELSKSSECIAASREAEVCADVTCPHYERTLNASQARMNPLEACKTLWFSAMHEGPKSLCRSANGMTGFQKKFYAAALASAVINAADTLQPVLILGRYGLNETTELSPLGRWAAKQGAIVITLDRLSFQDDIRLPSSSVDDQMGWFIRLDIPRVVDEHKLFSLPQICQQHVLYTDTDVVFPNKITHQDLHDLKQPLMAKDVFLSYGPQDKMNRTIPLNTGVMMMDVPEFAKHWPSILEMARKMKSFPHHDQLWLNYYFSGRQHHLALLSYYWNWKPYWQLEPSAWNDIKAIHYHGPKPHRGLDEIAHCVWPLPRSLNSDYKDLVRLGACCDKGKVALAALELFELLQPAYDDICLP